MPKDAAFAALIEQYGGHNFVRIQKFFEDKRRRVARKGRRAVADSQVVSLDEERLRILDAYLFPEPVVSACCPSVRCVLRHILRLENVGELRDVGYELQRSFSTPAGWAALRGYQQFYWLTLRLEMLALSTAKSSTAKFGAASLEFRTRGNFPEIHAYFHLGSIFDALTARRARAGDGNLLTVIVGRRQMSAINERVRDFLRS
eukprot:IDg2429t1